MIMKRLHQVTYNAPSRFQYLKKVMLCILRGNALVHFCSLVSYYLVNYVVGRSEAKIGQTSKVHPTVILRHGERIVIGEHCLINHNNALQAGKVKAKIIIGDYVQTGPGVKIFAYNHGMAKNGVPMIQQDYLEADVIIGDDVWIGANSVITAGVKIGEGCVIGAGAVVTGDLDAYGVYVGVPARKIKERS